MLDTQGCIDLTIFIVMKKLLTISILFLLVACGKESVKNVPDTTTTTANHVQTTVTNPPVEDDPSIVAPPVTSTSAPKSNTPTTVKAQIKPASSNSIGHISIPAIGLDWPIYEGIELSVLNKGPGHYPHSPKPCRAGNAAIAGHRTTYGAPFNKLDLLKSGDIINITTPEGDCTYKYLRTEIVSPTNIDVVNPKGGNFLTLTACHPKGSAAKRITVTATLENVTVK